MPRGRSTYLEVNSVAAGGEATWSPHTRDTGIAWDRGMDLSAPSASSIPLPTHANRN